MNQKISTGRITAWHIILAFLLVAAVTCWWFGKRIALIDEKIETFEKK